MKVLLTTLNSKYIHQNLAIRLLFELNKDYQGLYFKEFFNKENFDSISNYCSNYQLVAFSCYIWNITQTLELAKKIKTLNPSCKILLGGPEVSYEWNDIIELDEIDFIIKGEGEIPFSAFLKSFPVLENIPDLIWKKNKVVIENRPGGIFNLKQLKNINPYINDSGEDLKNKISYIESSRGCPHSCEFCMAGLENKVRYLPAENIYANLLYLMQNGRIIKFLDRTFNTNTKFAISIFKFIIDNYKTGNIFQFEIKADNYHEEFIEFIKSSVPKGIFRFEIGIQTLNNKSNNEVKRKQNFENVKKFIAQVSDKIEIHLDLIVGLPFDYYDDIKYSFEEVFKLYAPELQLGFLKFLKGTPLKKKYKTHQYKFNKVAPYQIIESSYLSENEIVTIAIIEQALEIYWNKKRALHTLKFIASNYSIFDFLLGLGLYFKQKTGLNKYGLNEIFTNLFEFTRYYYPDDKIITKLVAIDYYLYHKIKPQKKFLPEIEKKMKFKILNKLDLNHNKYRYIIHPINFKVNKFLNENVLDLSDDLLIFQYDGINRPQIVTLKYN